MKQTAIIYARVSTVRQADEGVSIDAQIEQARKKAEELGVSVMKVFRDDGVSGRTDNRPEFQAAITYCAAYSVDYFITWNTSRFARNKIDAASYKKMLRGIGCKVIYVSTNINQETDEGWFTESIFEILDEHYSRQVGKDTTRSMIKNAEDGYYNGGRVPFGYEAVPDGKRKRLQIVESEAAIVREIFRRYLSTDGFKIIAMTLNDRGITFRGSPWSKSNVALLLKNMVYGGYIVFNRTDRDKKPRPRSEWIMTKSHPPIIGEEDMNKVQELLASRAPAKDTGSPHSNYVFTGILHCHCGASMQIETATGRSKTYSYYNCSRVLKGSGCKNRRIAAEEFDDWMVDIILDRILSPERMREVLQEMRDLSESLKRERDERRLVIVKEIKSASARRSKIFDVLELHGREAPNMADLTIRLRSLNEQITKLERSLEEFDNPPPEENRLSDIQIAEAVGIIREVILKANDPKRLRTFMQTFINQIMINGEEVNIEYKPEAIIQSAEARNKKPPLQVVQCKNRWLPDLGSNQGPTD